MLSLDDILINELHSARGIGVGGGNGIISPYDTIFRIIFQYLEKKLNLKNNTQKKKKEHSPQSLHHHMKLYFEIIYNMHIYC